MGYGATMDGMIEEKLLNLHTAFIGKVVSVQKNGTLCSVQPLDKIKAYGQAAKAQAIITNVPVLSHVRHFSLSEQTISVSVTEGTATVSPAKHGGHLKVSPIRKGDIVLCVCTERDLSASSRGSSTVPPVGHHNIKDAVVVGLLGGW